MTALAERFHDHPALALWHVSNELGGHNAHCYCDVSADGVPRLAARPLPRRRRGSTRRGAPPSGASATATFEEVLPPRTAPTFANPTQQLDFARFSSDALLDCFQAERDLLHRLSPGIPVTTNFMVMSKVRAMDYLRWGPELDVVAQDHYLDARRPRRARRALVERRPDPRHRPRPPVVPDGALDQRRQLAAAQRREGARPDAPQQPGARRPRRRRRLLLPVARLPRRRREVPLRAAAARRHRQPGLARGGRARGDPRSDRRGRRLVGARRGRRRRRLGLALGRRARQPPDRGPARTSTATTRCTARCGTPGSPSTWSARRPTSPATASSWCRPSTSRPTRPRPTSAGTSSPAGPSLVTYWSGIVDENDHVRLGGYPGAFRELLGVRTEEFYPLREGEQVRLEGGLLDGAAADVWTELLEVRGAEAVSSYGDGALTGVPALTVHRTGSGTAWYLATRLDAAGDRDAGAAPVHAGRRGSCRTSRGSRQCDATVLSRRTCSSSTTPTVRSRSRPPAPTW